jgi:esterase
MHDVEARRRERFSHGATIVRTMSAKLHHEAIGTGTHRMLLTHGIYGAGSNWRAIARKVSQQRTDYTVILVDLRHHGRSEGGEPPHTLAACAEDIRSLCEELGGVDVLAGHSFGGKVMLQTRAVVRVAQTWMFDSSPSPRPGDPRGSVTAVLELMERLPKTWPSRDAFVNAVLAEGHPQGLAQWLGMNVVADGETYTLRLDLAAVREMLQDYYAQDLWPIALDPAFGDLELVIADRSDTISAADRTRLASAPSHVHSHHIDAGHWLHIDAPANVVELLVAKLPTSLR